jgi:ribonuclease HI
MNNTLNNTLSNILYVDGGCNNKTGKGAYAFILVETFPYLIRSDVAHGKVLAHGVAQLYESTNNIAELTAVYKGLLYCEQNNINVTYILTDSLYVQKGVTEWSMMWKITGWRNSTGNLIANSRLWKDLLIVWDRLNIQHTIQFLHTRGHIGVYWNEECDTLCTLAYRKN